MNNVSGSQNNKWKLSYCTMLRSNNMQLLQAILKTDPRKTIFVSSKCFPQTTGTPRKLELRSWVQGTIAGKTASTSSAAEGKRDAWFDKSKAKATEQPSTVKYYTSTGGGTCMEGNSGAQQGCSWQG